ncbi:galactose oxidase-like protein [Ulvibacter sp. MAR_2010_11]|uniref:hypothetical protein n=1 Tax=Ulvibacter sp. MAR_2010_11 TaxID=1250229 RepID=UPI000C2C5818|nr:hypothetical protein [Ulvibacter sp. MAR_2010_11]PKA82960.1 galactose oxidase-like protein [Ulvibacter sp. MAR_2010_11]
MKISKFILFLCSLIVTISCSKEDTPEGTTNPSSFNLLLVSNNATEVSFTPTFTWQESSGPNGETITYDLYIQKANEVPDGSLPTQLYSGNLTTNTHTLTTPLLASTAYKWYVKSKNSSGGSTNSSSVFSFVTAEVDNLPPEEFFLLLPLDNEIDIPSSTVLTWEASSDPEGRPISYRVFLGINIPDTQIGNNLPDTSLPVGSLLPNTVYAWYVQALDDAGNIRNSSIFQFTTADSSSSGNYILVSSNSIPGQQGRFGHQMVDYNGKLYIIGGSVLNDDNTGGEYNDVWSSDDEGDTWTLVKGNTPEIGFVRSDEHQAVVFNNEIWVLNGNRNTAHKSSDGVTWENMQFTGNVSMGTHYDPRHQHQAVVFNGRLYIIGGSAGGILRNDVWSTDGVPDNDGKITWIKETDDAGFEPRVGHQVVIFNNKFYLTGGYIQGGQRMNDVWSSTDGINWTLVTAAAPYTERTEHVLVVQKDGQAMWLIGGDGIDPNTGTTVDSLNDSWKTTNGTDWVEESHHVTDDTPSNVFKGRKEFDAVGGNGHIIITMGKNGTQLLNDTWKRPN